MHLIQDGLRLARVGCSTDDEVIGERSDFAKIQNPKIYCLFGFSGLGSGRPIRKIFGGFDGSGKDCSINQVSDVLLPVGYYTGKSISTRAKDANARSDTRKGIRSSLRTALDDAAVLREVP
jgi:hypothetical protein